jgi:hypothetical protein
MKLAIRDRLWKNLLIVVTIVLAYFLAVKWGRHYVEILEQRSALYLPVSTIA